jgi:hypothetical protein
MVAHFSILCYCTGRSILSSRKNVFVQDVAFRGGHLILWRPNRMTASRNNWISKVRAVAAAAGLLVCWISASAALAARSPDVCSMSCCVQVGHCCCTPHHAYVKGQGPDGRDTFTQASLSSTCPGGCTNSQSISRGFANDSDATSGYFACLVRSALVRSVECTSARPTNRDLAGDPRGPPLSSIQAFQV